MIDSKYATTPYRTLIGHSLGGLMVVNTLAFHTHLFNSYIAIDPSLFRYTATQFNSVKETLKNNKLKGITLYLAIANSFEGNYDFSNVHNCKGDTNIHIQKIIELDELIKKNVSQLDYQSKYYPEYSHETVPIIAELEGFRFIFRNFIYKTTADERDHLDQNLVLQLEKHYKELSFFLGYEVKVPFGQANFLAYEAMKIKNYEVANYLFQMNFNNDPLWWNACDSYGDYFNEIGNKEKALEFYEKAYTLHKNNDSKQKIKALKKGNNQ